MGSKNKFLPSDWLGQEKARTPLNELMNTVDSFEQYSSKDFSIQNFIVPEWKGQSLVTQNGLELKTKVKDLLKEALKIQRTFPARNKSLRNHVFNEFLSFAKSEQLNITFIKDSNVFWEHFLEEQSPYNEPINKFLKIYALRAVNIYLLKLRLVCLLYSQLGRKITANELLNPDHTISMIFRRTSSTELSCDSLSKNEYSWFRPSHEYEEKIESFAELLSTIGLNEFLNITNYEIPNELNILAKSSENNYFSHAISNRSFGLFINDLLIKIPEWLESHQGYYNFSSQPKCTRTLFQGDFINSFALSHWLAQESNSKDKWFEVICPEFIGEDFNGGNYLKYCQELHFLNFLVYFSEVQNHEPISLICTLFKQINNKPNTDAAGQFSIFNIQQAEQQKSYERIVHNFFNLPKKNPHHLLVNNILKEGEKLTNNGYLYIFSNQKLFVPSHSERVQGLLKKLKLHARFNFENLCGRGEIPKYLYVFSKRMISSNWQNPNIENVSLSKESCLSFSFNGQLMQFSKFELQRMSFHRLISDQETINTPIFQEEVEAGLSFEFHQDAIINGKLLSHSSETSSITHPNYFKKLTKSCIPFDQFFIVETLAKQDQQSATSLLGIRTRESQRYPYLLIVNFSDENDVKLEITTYSLLKAKMEEYGHAYYQYFGLTPKMSQININLFREFFETDVGKQIIQLTFNGSFKKAKSKLAAMLIPKFFSDTKVLPQIYHNAFNLLNIEKEELSSKAYAQVEDSFKEVSLEINHLKTDFPWHISCLLSHFKVTCLDYFENLSSTNAISDLDYMHQGTIQSLIKLKTRTIFDSNEDIYIEPLFKLKSDFAKAMTYTSLERSEKDGSILKIYSNEEHLLNLRGEFEILHFINFILGNSIGTPINNSIQNLRVPFQKDLKSLIDDNRNEKQNIKSIITSCTKTINEIIVAEIFK